MAPKIAPKAVAAKAKAVAAKAKPKAAPKAVARPTPVVDNRPVRLIDPQMPRVLFDMYVKQVHIDEPVYDRLTLVAVCEYLATANWARIQDCLHKMLLFRPMLMRKMSKVWLTHQDNARVRAQLRLSSPVAVTASGVVRMSQRHA